MDVLPIQPGMDPSMLATQARSGDRRGIEEVAKGFESMFVSMLLKQMRETLEPGVMFGEDKSDVYGGLFDMFMGQYLAQQGAFGIANLVRKQLTRMRYGHSQAAVHFPAGGTSPGGAVPGPP